MRQDVEHKLAHVGWMLHGGIGLSFQFIAERPLGSQSRSLNLQLALVQKHLPGLVAVTNHLACTLPALLGCASGGLDGRHLQHRRNGRPPGLVDQLVAGHLTLRDQIHHGKERLGVLRQKAG